MHNAKLPTQAEDDDGLAPIHMIIDSENVDMLRQLTLHGANVDQQMADGVTAMHLAAAKGSMKMLKMLIMKKADINICMADGESPIATVRTTHPSAYTNTAHAATTSWFGRLCCGPIGRSLTPSIPGVTTMQSVHVDELEIGRRMSGTVWVHTPSVSYVAC